MPINRIGWVCVFLTLGSPVADTKGTVLVVDDEEPILAVASEILNYLGYSVLTSPSGEEAVDRLRQGAKPDVVLLDIVMPGMNGLQTLRKLREIEPGIPILISTGYSDRGAAQSLLDEGVDGFVNKPYHIETLAQQIERILG